jgi:hypothetical protein
MRIYALLVALFALLASPQPQQRQKYPWQYADTQCNEGMTFCWYDFQVTAYGNRWVSEGEKPFEWITEVRCLEDYKLCILARNQKVLDGSQTNIDLYRIEEWSSSQILAIRESFVHNVSTDDLIRQFIFGNTHLSPGNDCEVDRLLLNRVEGSVLMPLTPAPGTTSKLCPIYELEIGPPSRGSSPPND